MQIDVRARLLDLLRREAVLSGDFMLSSGQRSDYYLDARRVTLSAAGAPLVGRLFLDVMRSRQIDAVAGMSVGADPIVSAIVVMAAIDNRNIDGLIVRKEPKAHGVGRRIEGPWREGLKVAVVEDTATTGASALEAARAVSDAGGEVVGIFVLIDRDQGARESASAEGYYYQSIYPAADLVAEASSTS